MASLSCTCDSGLYTRMTPFASLMIAGQHASYLEMGREDGSRSAAWRSLSSLSQSAHTWSPETSHSSTELLPLSSSKILPCADSSEQTEQQPLHPTSRIICTGRPRWAGTAPGSRGDPSAPRESWRSNERCQRINRGCAACVNSAINMGNNCSTHRRLARLLGAHEQDLERRHARSVSRMPLNLGSL